MPRKPSSKAKKPRSKSASEGIAPTTLNEERKVPAKKVTYSVELATRICQEMLERDHDDRTRSLRDVCRLEGMPTETSVYRWLQEYEDFREMYTRTRETLADMNANDVLKIADTAADPNIARVRIDARKWWAAKVAPKKYGDKTLVGGDPDNPVRHSIIERVIVDPAAVS